MRVLDRLLNEQKKKNDRTAPEPDEVEIMMEMPVAESINTNSSVYDRGIEKIHGGINTAPSVFDQKALFHVKQSDE